MSIIERAIYLRNIIRFPGSQSYWESRYARGGTSGAGSYGPLAEYKADFLNEFVASSGLERIVEWGCGDGNQLSLAKYPCYLGLDVSATAIRMCVDRFKDDRAKSFAVVDEKLFTDRQGFIAGDIALSLDVIYHLIEDDTYESYMAQLFMSAHNYVIIYSSNVDGGHSAHVKHRVFTSWVAQNAPAWTLLKELPNPLAGTGPAKSFANFFIFGNTENLDN